VLLAVISTTGNSSRFTGRISLAPDATAHQPEVIGIKQEEVCGPPGINHVSTSYVERQNLSMRMGMRRFTRLTNAHSKKVENHAHAIALYFMHYNYCKIHPTLRVTPAMEAGLAKSVWEMDDLAALVEAEELRAIEAGEFKRGKYKAKTSD
jgi:hypothetical protein